MTGAPGTPAAPPGPTDGRTRHYGDFYGVLPADPADGRPVVVVHGNCQAESLRLLLAADDVVSERLPAVH